MSVVPFGKQCQSTECNFVLKNTSPWNEYPEKKVQLYSCKLICYLKNDIYFVNDFVDNYEVISNSGFYYLIKVVIIASYWLLYWSLFYYWLVVYSHADALKIDEYGWSWWKWVIKQSWGQ